MLMAIIWNVKKSLMGMLGVTGEMVRHLYSCMNIRSFKTWNTYTGDYRI